MSLRIVCVALISGWLSIAPSASAAAEQPQSSATVRKVRVTGVVRDEFNAITLPGVPVEVVGDRQVVYTDVDGRFEVELAPGHHELRVTFDGYSDKTIGVDAGDTRNLTVDVGLSMARFSETIVVTGAAPVDALVSSAAAQLVERKNAQVVSPPANSAPIMPGASP